MVESLYVDSSGWIALLSRRDRLHAEALRLFARARQRKIRLVTSDLVLAEVHRLLLHRAGIAPALSAVERITAVDGVSVEFLTAADHGAALDWLRRYRDQIFTYTDAASFALMQGHGCRRFIGFDHHFEVAGFTRWS